MYRYVLLIGTIDSALYDSITNMAAEFEARLDGTEAVLTPKAVYIHRKNCGTYKVLFLQSNLVC